MKKYLIYIVLTLLVYNKVAAYDKIIVIDPGHDWDNTTGVLTPVRTETEVNTNWEVANELKTQIENMYNPAFGLNWQVVLTREDNNAGSEVTLLNRERIANNLETANHGKVYFLSIHCNGGGSTGTETFYCNETFASNNNLLTSYAQSINNNMVELGEWQNRRCVNDYSYYGYHLGVLDNLTMPNCLNEIGFADNIDDEIKLLNPVWRRKFAQAYFEGFRETFGDLNILSFNIEQVPDFVNNPSKPCKISVTIKNVDCDNSWSGEIRAVLRDLPLYSYESPTNTYCQLGSTKSFSLNTTSQKTVTFEGQIPMTMDIGKVLHLESKKTGSTIWQALPTSSHKKIIKVPLNGSLIKTNVYNSYNDPLWGVAIRSYALGLKSIDMSDPLSDIYDPYTDRTDKYGYIEIFMPYSWGQGALSVANHPEYEEVNVIPNAPFLELDSWILESNSGGGGNSNCYSSKEYGINGIAINGNTEYSSTPCTDVPLEMQYIKWETSFPNCSYGVKFPVYTTDYRWSDNFPAYIINKEDCHIHHKWTVKHYLCGYTKVFISIQKVDKNRSIIGTEYSKWYYKQAYMPDWNWELFESYPVPEYKNSSGFILNDEPSDVLINFDLTELGIELISGQYYKVKIAGSGTNGAWHEDTRYFKFLKDQLVISQVPDGNVMANKVEIMNTEIDNEPMVSAAESITIKPNTLIKSGYFAVDNSLCSTYAHKSVSLDKDIVEQMNYNLPYKKLNRDFDFCSCQAETIEILDLEDENISTDATSTTVESVFNTKNEILISPNPTTGIINIEMPEIKSYYYQVDNINGLMINNDTSYGSSSIDLSNQPAGIYFLTIRTQKGAVIRKKLVKI